MEKQEHIAKIVSDIIEKKCNDESIEELEKDLNGCVYELYELTNDEIVTVEAICE